jgi:nucleoside-diphosphate-sugar epimerase
MNRNVKSWDLIIIALERQWSDSMIVHTNSKPVKPSRVLVLGALGFVGKELVKHLSAQGIACLPLDLPEIDLLQSESVDKLANIIKPEDMLVFTSALTPEKGKDRGTMLKNIHMAEHVCLTLEKTGCSHVVYMSSDAVYGSGKRLLNEKSPCEPDNFYGMGHYLREQMIRGVCSQKNISLTILRSSAIYGAGDTHNSYGPNRFLRTAINENKITLIGQGEEKRSHFYVGDVVRVIDLCLRNKTQGILNMAVSHSITFMELAEKVSEVLKTNVKIECTQRSNPVSYIHFDTTEFCKAFPGFRFTNIEDGLKQMLDVMRP